MIDELTAEDVNKIFAMMADLEEKITLVQVDEMLAFFSRMPKLQEAQQVVDCLLDYRKLLIEASRLCEDINDT